MTATPLAIQWSAKREPATDYSVPLSIAYCWPEWGIPHTDQARRIVLEFAELPQGAPRVALFKDFGRAAMERTDVAQMHRTGIPRDYDRPVLRDIGNVFATERARLDMAVVDLEGNEHLTLDENNPRVAADLGAVWDYDEFFPWTPADFVGYAAKNPARTALGRKSRRLINDHIRWGFDGSNYVPCRAGMVSQLESHGGKGDAAGTVTHWNGVPLPAYRPGRIDTPVVYLNNPGDSAHHVRNCETIVRTSDGELVPWVSDAPRGLEDEQADMLRALAALGMRRFLWWSMDADRVRAHEVMGEALRGGAA
jgi:hypothetical protein